MTFDSSTIAAAADASNAIDKSSSVDEEAHVADVANDEEQEPTAATRKLNKRCMFSIIGMGAITAAVLGVSSAARKSSNQTAAVAATGLDDDCDVAADSPRRVRAGEVSQHSFASLFIPFA